MTQRTYAHGVLTHRTAQNDFTWKVFAKEGPILDEQVEWNEHGPEPDDHLHMIAMLGDRGWEMFQVDAGQSGDSPAFEFWFRRRTDVAA